MFSQVRSNIYELRLRRHSILSIICYIRCAGYSHKKLICSTFESIYMHLQVVK